jgi:hypothetical protein
VEVVSGLDRGDLVVTAGQIKLREGTEVTVADFGAGATATQ